MNCSCMNPSNQTMNCNHAVEEEWLLRIQQTDFLLVDLQLYLDNHPDCQSALEDYNALAQASMELKAAYQQHYGPLMNYGTEPSGNQWTWTDEPWPWERKRR